MNSPRSNARIIRFALFALLLIACGYILSTGSSYQVPAQPASNAGSTTPAAAAGTPADVKADDGSKAEPVKAQAPVGGNSIQKQLNPGTIGVEKFPPPATAGKVKATFVSLARNSDLYSLLGSIRQVEDRFNNKFNYDWVFLNDEEFSDEFKEVTSTVVSGTTKYGLIPKEQWSYPDWIDQEKAALAREKMVEKKVIYGGSVSYRHMCRYESGFFWRHPLLDEYEYYWRVEPDIKIYCDIDYDVFQFMKDNKKRYSFTITLPEYKETILTLWDTTKKFIKENQHFLAKDNMLDWLSNDNGETYNGCHFWSNFEIADLNLWRSDAYKAYFDALDQAGGFFYERWGDAPVHSIAAALFLNKDEFHFFDDVGYFHVPFNNCPVDPAVRKAKNCACNPKDDFSWKDYSCTKKYHTVRNLPRMQGWENFSG